MRLLQAHVQRVRMQGLGRGLGLGLTWVSPQPIMLAWLDFFWLRNACMSMAWHGVPVNFCISEHVSTLSQPALSCNRHMHSRCRCSAKQVVHTPLACCYSSSRTRGHKHVSEHVWPGSGKRSAHTNVPVLSLAEEITKKTGMALWKGASGGDTCLLLGLGEQHQDLGVVVDGLVEAGVIVLHHLVHQHVHALPLCAQLPQAQASIGRQCVRRVCKQAILNQLAPT